MKRFTIFFTVIVVGVLFNLAGTYSFAAKVFVNSIAFSPDGLLASADTTVYDLEGGKTFNTVNTVKLWNVKTRALMGTFPSSDWVKSVAFSPDSSLLAGGGSKGEEVAGFILYIDDEIILWDVKSRTPVAVLDSSAGDSVAFSPDGSLLASGGGMVELWDLRTKTLVVVENSDWGYNSVAFGPDGSLLASGYDDGVKLWDAKSGALLGRFPAGSVDSVAFSPLNLLASGGNYSVKIFDVRNKKLSLEEEFRSDGLINSITFSPDGSLLAGGDSDGNVVLWDMKNRNFITKLKVHSDSVKSVAFSPDGSLLACGGKGGGIELWNMRSVALVATLKSSDNGQSVFSTEKLVTTWGAIKSAP